jgi:tRNA A-37 threonylcarbamoyl transferase component Bud32
MNFLLSSQNVLEYLAKHNLCDRQDKDQIQIELKAAKNFNLLVKLNDGHQLIVKQEPHNSRGHTAGKFTNEWRFQQFLAHFSELSHLRPWLTEVVHFNADDSIIVFNYLDNYCDLADFYRQENVFSTAIASTIGRILATIHRTTFNRQDYQNFLSNSQLPKLARGLDRITPEAFGLIPVDGLKFFTLYQRYESLGQAIAKLVSAFDSCCLVHNDLKLNNILLHLDWEQPELSNSSFIRLIDWEFCSWGDPAFDLGHLICSYLQLWLNSLVVSNTISIEESLGLAMTPLQLLQPSIAALTQAYLKQFPEIVVHRPNFLHLVMQFAGLALIQHIHASIQYQKAFGNVAICTLQVAKSLLCRPAQSILTVFGLPESELTVYSCIPV